jgi:hypothetical protein
MKKLHFIIQAKGGVGKSLLTYLMAQSQKDNPDAFFVDVDGSTQTSTRQLKFLGEKRVESITLLNNDEVLIRDLLIQYLESLSKTPFKEIYFDFGAPESEQFPALISKDLPFKLFLEEMNFTAHFLVVIAGGGSYLASVNYLNKIFEAVNHEYPITVWKNITSFKNSEILTEELQENCDENDLKLAQFGDFEPNTSLGIQILDHISLGSPLEAYKTGARLKMKSELLQHFKPQNNGN